MSLSIALTMVFCGCAYLDDLEENTFPADITVDELSDNLETAADPKGIFKKCHSYLIKQEMSTKGADGSSYTRMVEVKFKLPNSLRTTTFMNGKPVLAVISNGKQAWNVNCETDEITEIKGSSYQLIEVLSELGHPSSTMISVFPKIDLSEVITSDDPVQRYYKATCYSKYKDLPPIIFYIGKENFLTKRLETTRFTTGGSYKYISETDKYSMYDCVWIASESRVIVDDMVFKYKVIEYKMNIDIPDSEFQLTTPWYLKNTEKVVKPTAVSAEQQKAPAAECK